jgi:hypothetical protein
MTKSPAVRSYVELWEVLHPNTGSEKLHIRQDYIYKSYVEGGVVEEGGTV